MRDPEKFKIGFLRGLAELGCTPDQFVDAMSKSADTSTTLKNLVLLGLLPPAVLGAVGGGVLHSALAPGRETYQDVKSEELENMYRNAARRVQARAAERKKRSGGPIVQSQPAQQPGHAGGGIERVW